MACDHVSLMGYSRHFFFPKINIPNDIQQPALAGTELVGSAQQLKGRRTANWIGKIVAATPQGHGCCRLQYALRRITSVAVRKIM